MSAVYPNIGDKYGFLTLTGKSFIKFYGGANRRFVECECECNNIFFTLHQNVKAGLVKSCGCKTGEMIAKAHTIHGKAKRGKMNPIYSIWQAVIQRCTNVNTIGAKNYVKRGIWVCEEWANSFESFYDWAINNGWEKGLSIERKDNNGNYEPSNCRWATYKEQSRNKRTNYLITAFGETKCFKDWRLDKRCKVSHGALFYRLHTIKMLPEEAISIPPFKLQNL